MNAPQRPIGNYIFEDIYKVDEEKQNKVAISFKGVNYSFLELEKSVNYFAKELINKGVKEFNELSI